MRNSIYSGTGVCLAAILAVWVAGCSGGSDFGATPSPSPSPSASPSPSPGASPGPIIPPGRLTAEVMDGSGNALATFSQPSQSLAIGRTRFSATYAATPGVAPSIRLTVESEENLGQLVPIIDGQIFVFGETTSEVPGTATLTFDGSLSGISGVWEAVSGRLVVVSIDDARVRYRLEDVVLTPRGSDDSGPEVRLEGTGEILR
jgi:hypothetical protein